MTSSSHQAGASPRSGEAPNHDIFPERHHDEIAAQCADKQYQQNSVNTPHDLGALQDYPSFFDRSYGIANDYSQYQDAHTNPQAEGSVLRDRQRSESASPFAQHNDHAFLRGIERSVGVTSPGIQGHELVSRDVELLPETPSPYSFPVRSASVGSGSPGLLLMQSFPQSSDQGGGQGEQVPTRQTKYAPCPSRLDSSAAAREYRRTETQFGRVPYKDPDSDPTIQDVEYNRKFHVKRIYNAMTSGDKARDNTNSVAVKRWIGEAHYSPELVEAYAHRVLDCVLSQAKHGFRGWIHNDYVADERKGDDIDKEVDCAGRLDNVIQALEWEKTICEDVVTSSSQTRMFVNAPRAYAQRKHQNRLGNMKRGKPKDALDENPAKRPRAGGKRKTRARSNTASDMPSSRGNTPQYQQPQLQTAAMTSQYQQQQKQMAASTPYFSASNYSNLSPSPLTSGYPVPRSTPLQRPSMSTAPRNSFQMQSLNLTSPPPATSPQLPHGPQSQIARTATMPPHLQSPMMTGPRLPSHSPYIAQATPDEAKPGTDGSQFAGWHPTTSFDGLPLTNHQPSETAIDPRLMEFDFSMPHGDGGSSTFPDPSSGFVCPADIEMGGGSHGNMVWTSEQLHQWSSPNACQNFSSTEGSSEHKH